MNGFFDLRKHNLQIRKREGRLHLIAAMAAGLDIALDIALRVVDPINALDTELHQGGLVEIPGELLAGDVLRGSPANVTGQEHQLEIAVKRHLKLQVTPLRHEPDASICAL